MKYFSCSYRAVIFQSAKNATHFFIMKILNKIELGQIAYNNSSDINSKIF